MEKILAEICNYEKIQIEPILNILNNHFSSVNEYSFERVNFAQIQPLCKHVYSKRLHFAKNSICSCIKNDIPLFAPYAVNYCSGDTHWIVPPIVEKRNNIFYLCDGMHRFYSIKEYNIKWVNVIVIHKCELPLPGTPTIWKNVVELDQQLPSYMNFENFCPIGLTNYSKFCNSDDFWFRD